MTVYRLFNRSVIRLSPLAPEEDTTGFLQALVTNDVAQSSPVWAGLLSAQGKAMFDFIIWHDGADILIDCEELQAPDLVKRLSLYRLRRKIGIGVDASLGVWWSKEAFGGAIADPRMKQLGFRSIAPVSDTDIAGDELWQQHRLALQVPEGHGELGDILWLETNAAELNGVSFSKGCYIGQENTARMNWRQKVNRRLLVVPLERSDEKRRKTAYPDLGLAIDHLRVTDIPPELTPFWIQPHDC